jgi:mersacidin/lichenicidin family type 2 lantibiotic
MNINDILRAWKADEDDENDEKAPANPAGQELSDEELEQAAGGRPCQDITCRDNSCDGESLYA